MMHGDYAAFLDRRAQLGTDDGFDPVWMPDFLFPFQQALVEWALRKGRAAIFADCGLGKTPMQLVWADNVVRRTGKPVLIVTPLAVSYQTVQEGEKFGIEVRRSDDGTVKPGINVTNYERLHYFNPADFAGTVCDESSAIKAFHGVRREEVTRFMLKQQYRLLATATAAPNDFIELGTASEALGELNRTDMLDRFFKNDDGTSLHSRQKWVGQNPGRKQIGWRFKGHAEEPFWRWVASWARAARRPSDVGAFDDGGFVLPALIENEYIEEARRLRDGMLFEVEAVGLAEQREEMRRTIGERCERVASIVNARNDCSVVWCNLNDEGNLLERLIDNAVQVSGSDSDTYKEIASEWFVGHRCICNEPLFRAKLATWQQTPTTSRTTTNATAQSGLPRRENTNASTSNSERLTCAHTTLPTPTSSTSGLKSSGTTTTQRDASDTEPIQSSGSNASGRLENGNSPTLKSGSPKCCENTGSLPPTTGECLTNKAAGVQSAEAMIRETSADIGSTLTTVMQPDGFGGYCAQDATSQSESSETTRTDSCEPRCICGHASGKRVLVSKARMFGYGLNFQHCAHMTFFPSHSYEQYYQAVRRCWRFGQTRPVVVDVVTTKGGHDIMQSLQRKTAQADRMFTELVRHMQNAERITERRTFTKEQELPSWL